MNRISSDSMLIDINHHFRVSAGPGAGKTHWLVGHIFNVLHRSKKLGKTRKIACITYTNIAVETILKRLGTSSDRVEVSTIHSFLYKHIVKPYASFIAEEFGLNYVKMDGHDDRILSSYSFLKKWKDISKQNRIRDDKKIVEAFGKARWKFDGDDIVFKPDYPIKANRYSIRSDSYFQYKTLAWEKGVLHHEDVLFFSYHLIKKYPYILTILRKKFPYFFIDEFQDTNPIQAWILRKVGQKGTVIGIIGDKAQSIYGFQGADPEKFSSFELPDLIDYQIRENWRSTKKIIHLLNSVRSDISQYSPQNKDGSEPTIIVGDMLTTLREAKLLCNGEKIYSLSRDNITSNAMKHEINGTSLNDKLLEELVEDDKPSESNKYRSRLIQSCIKAVEFSREGKFRDSIKELERLFRDKRDSTTGKRKAMAYIRLLLSSYEDYKKKSLMEFYSIVKKHIEPDLSGFRKGKAKTFYDNHTYEQLALCVKIKEDSSLNKTIHKAKGDEFDSVHLILKEESDLSFLLNSDLSSLNKAAEEQRIYYVAVSRARKDLFISIPSLSNKARDLLKENFQIKVIEVGN